MMNSDYCLKFCIIGNSNVGKSSLLLRISKDSFSETFISTIGVDFGTRILEHENKIVRLNIWDCGGQEIFRSIINIYYRNADAIILTYSVCDEKSFSDIPFWFEDCKKKCNGDPIFILVGTKSDLNSKRKIKYNDGFLLAEKLGMKFFEVSSKEDTMVFEMIESLTKSTINLVNKRKENYNNDIFNVIKLDNFTSNRNLKYSQLSSNESNEDVEQFKTKKWNCCNIQ